MKHLTQVFQILRQQVLYAKLDKCELLTPQVVFIEYVVFREEIQVDESKIKTTRVSPSPLSS